MLSEFLHKLKGFTVDNGRVRVREDLPFLLRSFNLLFILERLCCTSEVYRIAAILLFGKNTRNRIRTPVELSCRRIAAVSSDTVPILRRRHNLVSFQLLGYLRRS